MANPVVEQTLQMQPVALVMLALYVATALILLPRELSFIRSVPPPTRRQFILQDVVLQAGILAVLVPSAVASRLTPAAMSVVVGGFTLLWLVAVWMAVSRQRYISRLLEDSRREGERLMAELSRRLREEQAKEESGD